MSTTDSIIKRLEAARDGQTAAQGPAGFILGTDPKRWPPEARTAYWDTVRALNAWGKEQGLPFGAYDNLGAANRAVRETWGRR